MVNSLFKLYGYGKVFTNTATLGAGCYWGTEKYLKVDYNKKYPGVISSGKVGFVGPKHAIANPTYEDVCTGTTGHVEVFQFDFNGDEETYASILKHFFSFHDPTTMNQQGNCICLFI